MDIVVLGSQVVYRMLKINENYRRTLNLLVVLLIIHGRTNEGKQECVHLYPLFLMNHLVLHNMYRAEFYIVFELDE
jgi:hypothetical protein